MKVAQIKAELDELGLSTKGNKATLLARLEAASASEAPAAKPKEITGHAGGYFNENNQWVNIK